MDYFHRKIKTGHSDECWPWLGCLVEQRERACYGAWNHTKLINERKPPKRAHQAAYWLFKGDVPEGKQVLHTCDNSLCCNPDHLYAGTPADNVLDRDTRGRAVVLKGSQHGGAVINEGTAAQIIYLLNQEGAIATVIAKNLNVTPAIVYNIKYGKT